MTLSLKNMTKTQLEEYGRSLGIELDKRLKKSALILQIQEFLDAPQTVESIKTRPDRVHAVEEAPGDVQEFVNSLPEYTGTNNGEISRLIMKALGKLSDSGKVKFGPVDNEYHVIIGDKTYKL
jgi:hypothetical protein